jgi:hypothetical protein
MNPSMAKPFYFIFASVAELIEPQSAPAYMQGKTSRSEAKRRLLKLSRPIMFGANSSGPSIRSACLHESLNARD